MTETFSPALHALPSLLAGDRLPATVVTAHNNSLHSTNKIHDDDVARRYGFRGGLVPGVTVFAYMTTPLAAALGERWLSAGSVHVSLINPLYEGERAVACAEVAASETADAEGSERIVLAVWVENPAGIRCAVGQAAVPRDSTPPQIELPDYALAPARPLPASPPPLELESAPVGSVLAPLVVETSVEGASEYAAMVFDENPLFHQRSSWGPPLIHPGWLLSECNAIFSRNFSFGPWIHTRSEVQYLGPALAGTTFTLHGRLTEAYERRGHHYAAMDLFCVDDRSRPVMRTRHVAIFRVQPRD